MSKKIKLNDLPLVGKDIEDVRGGLYVQDQKADCFRRAQPFIISNRQTGDDNGVVFQAD